MTPASLDLPTLRAAYLAGRTTPAEVLAAIDTRADASAADNIWIHRLDAAARAPFLARLAQAAPADLPLYGVPFAIKDNIDLAGVPTSAGCPAFAYLPTRSAPAVERLIAAGAIPVGKTNLDQFATGLVGTRSPYGATRNAFNPAYISGGSSSGSAVACAKGLASFALGTDTAGSGRVPAALNGLFGLKPTRGLVSTRGVVPACRSLDCVSVFTLNAHDAWRVLGALAAYDDADDYARQGAQLPGAGASFRFAVPRELEFFGDPVAPARFAAAVARLADCGGEAVEIDFTPFLDAARLLYEGPWVSERYAAIKEFIARAAEAMHPVTRAIIEAGGVRGAVELFEANHRLQHLKRVCDRVVADVACVLTPTLGRAYTLAEVEADPVRLNSNLGHYTNFMNLLDYAAVAVPAGTGHDGVPVGVTLFGPALSDARLLGLAARFAGEIPGLPPPGAFESEVLRIVVCGAHLSGLPLNGQLTSRGAVLLRATRTAPCYRLFALPAGPPWRPGLVRDPAQGAAIEVEEWALPAAAAGGFLDGIPSPLVIGRVELADGSRPHGFLCEAWAVSGAREITGLGGWRAHLAAQATS